MDSELLTERRSIRNLDDEVKERLRVRAARHGRSMEAEVRTILTDAVAEPREAPSMFQALMDRFGELGGIELELSAVRHPTPGGRFRLVIVVDTNVVSELMRPSPSPQVRDWIIAQAPGELCTTAVTVAEI